MGGFTFGPAEQYLAKELPNTLHLLSVEKKAMIKVIEVLKRFACEEEGLSAVEYAIAGALVIGVAAGSFVILGENVNDRVSTMAGCVAGPDTCT